MSRSQRKTSIFGMTTCRSERTDKVLWHGRLRTHIRTAISGLTTDELADRVLPEEQNVSNVWAMGKDGRQWWPIASQRKIAHKLASRRGITHAEQAAIEQRLLRKWMAK